MITRMTQRMWEARLATLYWGILFLWLGAALAVSFVAIPVVFSPAVKSALPAQAVGLVAQGILGRFFWVQLGLAAVALFFRWETQERWTRGERLAWVVLVAGSILAVTWIHPKLRTLYLTKYDLGQPAAVREQATAEFGHWHGASQAGNLLMLLTLGGLAGTRGWKRLSGGY